MILKNAPKTLRFIMFVGGCGLAISLFAFLLYGPTYGYNEIALFLFGAIAICAAIGFTLTWFERAASVATGLNLVVFTASIILVGWQLFHDTRTVRPVISQSNQALNAYQNAVALGPPTGPIADTDFADLLPQLNILRNMPFGITELARPSLGSTNGVFLRANSVGLYRTALSQKLLPRLLLRLEQQMQSNTRDTELLYNQLKAYLMLGQLGPMDAEFLQNWIAQDWETQYRGALGIAIRIQLEEHLSAMLRFQMDEIGLDAHLISRTREIINQESLAQIVYNNIVKSSVATDLPEFRITDVGGPAIARVFRRASGAPLDEGIPGIFTNAGFHEVFLNEAFGVALTMRKESYILGGPKDFGITDEAFLRMTRDILNLYYNDFVSQYDELLGDLDIIPMTSLSTAIEVTNLLSGPTSPMLSILEAVATETRLTERQRPPAQLNSPEALLGPNLNIRDTGLLGDALRKSEITAVEPKKPGQFVEDRFTWLHDLTEASGDFSSRLNFLSDDLALVYQELNRLSFEGSNNTQHAENAFDSFRQTYADFGETPLNRWVQQIQGGFSESGTSKTREALTEVWQQEVLPFCEAVSFSYPFDPNAKSDMSIEDFERLFSPLGLIDRFFVRYLADLVDTTSPFWSLRPNNSEDLAISDTVLRQMQYAADIRDAFFTNISQNRTFFGFQLTPEALDPKATDVSLDFGENQTVTYAHREGPPTGRNIDWDGFNDTASVHFSPLEENTVNGLRFNGPWAVFRLFEAAELRKTNDRNRQRVIFNVGGRIAIFQIQTDSAANPFTLPALREFECPKSF